MVHKNELVIQNLLVEDVALSTLAARAAISINSTFNAPDQSFLVKKVKYFLQMTLMPNGEDGHVLVVLNNGDATAIEVAAAFTEINTSGEDDTTQTLTQDNVWSVWQRTARKFWTRSVTASGDQAAQLYADISLGKGMVIQEGQGIAAHAVNLNNNVLATNSVIQGLIQLWGVWLRD